MAEYDLTKTIIPYLDRHLVFPLLTHLQECGWFTQDQVAAAQYELAKGTNMVDYIVSLYEQLNPDSEVPDGDHWLVFLPSCPRSNTESNQNLLPNEKER
jgi:translation initiation factor 3 subunit E